VTPDRDDDGIPDLSVVDKMMAFVLAGAAILVPLFIVLWWRGL
jgi:hypothetical protein